MHLTSVSTAYHDGLVDVTELNLCCWPSRIAPLLSRKLEEEVSFKIANSLGGSGAHLCSQHPGGRGRQSSECEASLLYRASST